MLSVASLTTPWYRRLRSSTGNTEAEAGSTSPTPILDHQSAPIRALIARASSESAESVTRGVLGTVHRIVAQEVRGVYALNETTPASRTLQRGFGSCSQRLAILESATRGLGIGTRSRALMIDRRFWAPRFPRSSFLLPPQILLAWPEFHLKEWVSASELFGPIGCRGEEQFTNEGSETLFEAAGRCAVDWNGETAGGPHDLSQYVITDYGHFTHRDEVFMTFGQTLCLPGLRLADPVLRRVAA